VSEPFTRFAPNAIAFLRALKRNNDREWFRARKEQYEELLRAPMIALIARLAADFRGFAPELVADPRVSLYRIYRDTRFSEDKRPLKTHVAAHFPHRGMARHRGAGLYLHVSPDDVWIGGGLYAPDTSELAAIREHLAANHRRFRSIVDAPRFRRMVGALEGTRLQRVPRGFPRDHPAAEYLRFRQFLAGRELPPSVATSPRFYASTLALFREVTPLVRFLNEPLIATETRSHRVNKPQRH